MTMKSNGKTMYEDVALKNPLIVATPNRMVKINEIRIKVYYENGGYYVSVSPQERTSSSVTEIAASSIEPKYRGACLILERSERYSSKKLTEYAKCISDVKLLIKTLFELGDMINLSRALVALGNYK